MTTVALPGEEMRRRLAPRLQNVRTLVWDPRQGEELSEPVDLLVLPYMIPAAELTLLQGHPISMVQSQMLGFDGVAEHLPGGIAYCNAVEVHEGSSAELALGLILAAQRGIPDAVRDADRGDWGHRRRPGLAGKRVLVIGVGGVGAEILKRLAPFDAEVLPVARSPREGVEVVARLPELLPEADIVVLAVPLTDETRHLVDDAFLGRMREGALLVNISRGQVVDTDALVSHLQRQRVRAALDVTDPEPLPAEHPLWSAPGVLITPHIGGNTDAMDDRVDRIVLEQVRRLRAGEPPLNLVLAAER